MDVTGINMALWAGPRMAATRFCIRLGSGDKVGTSMTNKYASPQKPTGDTF